MKRITVFLGALALATLWATSAFAGLYEDGLSYYGSGQYGKAVAAFQAALEADPQNLEAKKKLGDSYYALGKNAEAAKVYEEVLAQDPNDGVVRLHLAQVRQWQNDAAQAIETYTKLLDKEPENLTAMRELAEVYSWNKETYPKGIEICDRILKIEPKDQKALLIKARLTSWQGEHGKAAEVYEELLKLDPENDTARLEYANTLSYAKRYDDAINQFNLLVLKPKMRSQALIGLADAYNYGQRYADAVLTYQMVLEKDKNNVQALRGLGNAYAAQKRTREAVETYEKLATLEPENQENALVLANLYSWDESTYPQAIKTLEQLIAKDPNNADARRLLSRIYTFSNNHTEAQNQYKALLDADPDNADLRLEYARALRESGDFGPAIEQVDVVLAKTPDDVDAKVAKAQLLADSGKPDEAIAMFEEILATKGQEKNLEAQVGIGLAYHKKALVAKKRMDELEASIQQQWLGVFDRVRAVFAKWDHDAARTASLDRLEQAAKDHPTSSLPYIKLAEVQMDYGANEDAIAAYQKASQADPQDVAPWLGMSVVYGKMGNPDKSLDAIRRAAMIAPDNMEVVGGLSDVYTYQRDTQNAIKTLEQALASHTSDLDLRRKLAIVYSQNSLYYEKAIEQANYVLQQEPEDFQTRLLLARLYSWTEKWNEADREFQVLLSKMPEEEPVKAEEGANTFLAERNKEKALTKEDLYLEMMRVRCYGGRAPEVIVELTEKVQQQPDKVPFRLALAHAYEINKEYEKSETLYTQVKDTDPRNANAYIGLGTVYRETAQYDKAVLAYRDALAIDSESTEAYYGLGVIDRKSGNYERAIAMQRKVLEYDPTNVNGFTEMSYNHYLLSRRYVAVTGEYQRAWWLLQNSWGDLYGIYGEYPANIEQMRRILDEDPSNVQVRYLLAQELAAHNRYKEAAREYQKVLEYDPGHVGARLALAEIFSYDRDTYGYAIAQCIEVLKKDPENFDVRLRLARLYSWSGQFEAANQQYIWLLNRRPGNLDLREEYAQNLSYAKRYDDAIEQFSIVLSQDPGREDARMELAKLFAYNNRIDDAMKEYEVILKRSPNNYEAGFALANLYSWDRRYYGRAIDLYRRLYNTYPKNTEARLEMGRLMLERGEFEDAEAAYRDAIALEPDNVDAHIALGKVYIGMKKNGDAENEFQTALKYEPENVEAHFYMASVLSMNPDRYEDAIPHAEFVVNKEPENTDVRILLARLYSYETQYAKAAEHLQYVVDKGEDDRDVLLELARAYNYGEDYDSALNVYKTMAEKDPNDNTVRLEMGLCFLAVGQYQDAIVNLEYVAEQDPWNVEGRKGLARSYKQSGQVDQAIDQYKRIMIINPKDDEAAQYLKLYSIEYVDGAFVDSYFMLPGPGGPGGIKPGKASLYMSEAEQKYRVQLANELYNRQNLKRARYEFEKLVKANPQNAYYHLALANIYRQSGMWRSAIHEYKVAQALEPDNQEVKEGLARVAYESAPTLDVFAGYSEAIRFADRVGYFVGGAEFTYRFLDNWAVWARYEAGRFDQQRQDVIFTQSPAIGMQLGLGGEVAISGEYIFNIYDQNIDPTHNWNARASYDLLGVALFDLAYSRKDKRETFTSVAENIYMDSIGLTLTLRNLIGTDWDHFSVLGDYAYRINSESKGDIVALDSQTSNQARGGLGYTFFDPFQITDTSILLSYLFTYIDNETRDPYNAEVYWSPLDFYSHSLPIGWNQAINEDLFYSLGVSPTYSFEEGEDGWGVGLFGGVDWRINYNHALSLDADWSYGGVQDASFYAWSVFLNWRISFGDHSALEK